MAFEFDTDGVDGPDSLEFHAYAAEFGSPANSPQRRRGHLIDPRESLKQWPKEQQPG